MKGLARLEVEVLKEAASAGQKDTPMTPEMAEAVFRLVQRGLVHLVDGEIFTRGSFQYVTKEGHITALGRTALLIALTEPSLVTP